MNKLPWKRYLLHALGEVVLIVIGLLIALSLNSAVEERKWRKKEKTFLEDFQKALLLEIHDIQENREAMIEWSASIGVIDTFLQSDRPYHDTLDQHFRNLANFVFFIPTSRPKFEELKSLGFDLISDPEIRQQMLAYYELHVPYIYEYEGQADLAREDLRAYYLDHFSGWAYYGARPDDVEFIRQDKRFQHLVEQQAYFWKTLEYVYQDTGIKARELHDAICEKMEIC
ncbi:hypothetical protein [Flavilitoribacter nigricans]|uniref:Uncharacterized protein n=1 Tax=Flavilitoribacter nigricans (strain ATCC 23147 / DSM 23189 / NBRC 102662 / NCIMB 1420 / SS-2) TaxID=1122177 RepID=A0A2D0N513_FLAN2|nr:hypothetical protein [Flavilitoribacter nigricans]PHN03527.1 hypothetical protein CRP01_26370 [Flavilitoribacter nigricans DSM 23189 = NBRC 102662]